MIQLPSNFIDMAYVDVSHNRLLLHLKNDANQYFTHVHILDKAVPLDDHLQAIGEYDFTSSLAYVIHPATLETMYQAPLDQNWVPAPVPSHDVVSFAQYRAIKGLPNAA